MTAPNSTSDEMRSTRRDVLRNGLRLGALAGVAGATGGCTRIVQRATAPAAPESVALPEHDVEPIARLLGRTSFGPRPGEVARVAQMGVAAYLKEQLATDEDEDWPLKLRLHSLDAVGENAMELRDLQEAEVLRQLQAGAILRATYGRHQLRERLVDFWGNHFNVYARKGLGAYLITADSVDVVRTHALGKFPDLLRASAHSPAMLSYLDNNENRRGVPNENYARELMELHTLGVDGGYSQRDVLEVARCFSGWTVENRLLRRRGTFLFDASQHDNGAKIVLGHRIPAGGGQSDGDKVLSILANHPSTASFLSRKLCRYFRGDEDTIWTKRLALLYQQSGGDIRAMLRPLLEADSLATAPPIVKRPFDFLVSSLRALNADTDGGMGLQTHLTRMGQPLWGWPMPDGYPDRTQAWTGSLLARWNFAGALCGSGIANTSVDPQALLNTPKDKANGNVFDTLIEAMLSIPASAAPAQKLRKALSKPDQKALPPREMAALLLSSPAFQWR